MASTEWRQLMGDRLAMDSGNQVFSGDGVLRATDRADAGNQPKSGPPASWSSESRGYQSAHRQSAHRVGGFKGDQSARRVRDAGGAAPIRGVAESLSSLPGNDPAKLGLTAQRIYQDLRDEQGFSGKYSSVRRFVRCDNRKPRPFLHLTNWAVRIHLMHATLKSVIGK